MNSLARLIRLMTSRSSREHATGGCHTPGRTTPTTHHTGRDTLAPLEAATYPIRIPIRLPRVRAHPAAPSEERHGRPAPLRPATRPHARPARSAAGRCRPPADRRRRLGAGGATARRARRRSRHGERGPDPAAGRPGPGGDRPGRGARRRPGPPPWPGAAGGRQPGAGRHPRRRRHHARRRPGRRQPGPQAGRRRAGQDPGSGAGRGRAAGGRPRGPGGGPARPQHRYRRAARHLAGGGRGDRRPHRRLPVGPPVHLRRRAARGPRHRRAPLRAAQGPGDGGVRAGAAQDPDPDGVALAVATAAGVLLGTYAPAPPAWVFALAGASSLALATVCLGAPRRPAPAWRGGSRPARRGTRLPPGGAPGRPLPGGARGFSPGGARGFSPGGARGFSPGGARGFSPGGTRGFSPGGTRGIPPGGVRGRFPLGGRPGRRGVVTGVLVLATLGTTGAAVASARADAVRGGLLLARVGRPGVVEVAGTVAEEPRPLPHQARWVVLSVERVGVGARTWRTRERAGPTASATGRPWSCGIPGWRRGRRPRRRCCGRARRCAPPPDGEPWPACLRNGPGCWSAWPSATPRCCPRTSTARSGRRGSATSWR